MNTNERLTEAARRGAQGHTSTGASVFASLPRMQQQATVEHVMQNAALIEEIVRTMLNAMPREELEDLLNEFGETADPKAKEQQMHTGDKAQ